MKKFLICLATLALVACGSTPEKPANQNYEYGQNFSDITATRIAFNEFKDERDAIILELNRSKLDAGKRSEAKTWMATKDIAAIIKSTIQNNLRNMGVLDNTSNLVLRGALKDVQNQSVEGSAPGAFYLSITTYFEVANAGEVLWSQEIKAGSIVKEEDMKNSIDEAFAKSLDQLIGDLLRDSDFLQTLDQ